MADDAFDVGKMNVKLKRKQRIMRNTMWDGRIWKMYFTHSSSCKIDSKGNKNDIGGKGCFNRRKRRRLDVQAMSDVQ